MQLDRADLKLLELLAHDGLVGRRPERRGALAPDVRRHGEVVGGPGEGDVAESQLLLGVVGLGRRAVGVERRLVPPGELRLVDPVAAERGGEDGGRGGPERA